jgi:L-rhamnose mutarotase
MKKMKKTAMATALFLFGVSVCAAVLVTASAAPVGPPDKVQRYGMVIGLKPEKIAYYKELHAAAWPGVLRKIKECHIGNYSIYLKEVEPGKFLLFSYFEYTGDDFESDMAKMAADPTTRKWWQETDPCQIPLPTRGEKEFWSRTEEVFHLD